MFGRRFFNFLVILLVCATLKVKTNKRSNHNKENYAKNARQAEQNFHEVDAFGDDFVDFGAQTGPKGQFSW